MIIYKDYIGLNYWNFNFEVKNSWYGHWYSKNYPLYLIWKVSKLIMDDFLSLLFLNSNHAAECLNQYYFL